MLYAMPCVETGTERKMLVPPKHQLQKSSKFVSVSVCVVFRSIKKEGEWSELKKKVEMIFSSSTNDRHKRFSEHNFLRVRITHNNKQNVSNVPRTRSQRRNRCE